MKLAKLPCEPGALVEFFEDGLAALGALCERTWHDRLQIVAEGAAARLWNDNGELSEREIHFPAPDQAAPRDAEREVFPGCPLTFRLAETLHGNSVELQRAVLQPDDKSRAPAADVAERLWHVQFPGNTRWRMESNFASDWHFLLVAIVRCEIQAIDQHWSLHRLAVSLTDGEPERDLVENLALHTVTPAPGERIPWPAPDPARWQMHLQRALESELGSDLADIQQRQENYLRRELDRIDDYFRDYTRELTARSERSRSKDAKARFNERLAATQGEHERRRIDQVHRHEIRVIPRIDALLLLAEPAWRVTLAIGRPEAARREDALFVPRTRRWSARPQAP
jgi:hypothetical protein